MRQRVLMVDDEKAILMAFRELLGTPGVEVDTAETAEEAERLITSNDYQAVIVDVRLKGQRGDGGLAVLEHLRDTRPSAGTILVTGYGSPESMERAYNLGASFYFEKPVSVDALKDALRSLGVG